MTTSIRLFCAVAGLVTDYSVAILQVTMSYTPTTQQGRWFVIEHFDFYMNISSCLIPITTPDNTALLFLLDPEAGKVAATVQSVRILWFPLTLDFYVFTVMHLLWKWLIRSMASLFSNYTQKISHSLRVHIFINILVRYSEPLNLSCGCLSYQV